METVQNKRIDWVDIAKGIAIICMIIGHSVGKDSIGIFIFSFHMPIFFVLSGYTIKKIPAGDIPKATLKDFKRLIVPVFIVLFIDTILEIFYLGHNVDEVIKYKIRSILFGTLHKGMGKLWFLIALFWAKLFYRIMLLRNSKYNIIFLLVCAYVCSIIHIQLPQNFDIMFIILVFMEAGYALKNLIDENSVLITKISVAAFFIWSYLIWHKEVYIDLAVRLYPPLSILGALCGCLCIIQLSKFFEENKLINNIFSFFGRWSLHLLCIHQLNPYFIKYSTLLNFDGEGLSRLNPALHCFINLLLNILILIFLVVIKTLVKKIAKVGKK